MISDLRFQISDSGVFIIYPKGWEVGGLRHSQTGKSTLPLGMMKFRVGFLES